MDTLDTNNQSNNVSQPGKGCGGFPINPTPFAEPSQDLKVTSRPIFSQQVDISRPHTMLTLDTKRSGSLEYRYDDTQEIVTVPNIWYNQTFQVRVAAVLWDADRVDERAEKYEKYPPFGMSEAAAAEIAKRYRAQSKCIRSEAERMRLAGKLAYPVAASQMQLYYGGL